MRLIDRYLLRELVVPLAYCLCAFLVIWVCADMITILDEFQKHQLVPQDIAEYYLVRAPEILVTIIPIALLLGLLYALTNHARHNEITAIRAAGVSVWRLAAPYLLVGALCGLAILYLNERWVSDGERRAQEIMTRHTSRQTPELERQWRRELFFRNQPHNRTWRVAAYNLKTCEMIRPSVDWRLPNGSRREIYAERGIRTNDTWVFFDVRQLVHPPPGASNSTGPIDPQRIIRVQTNVLELVELSETPAQIESEIMIQGVDAIRTSKQPQLSIAVILNYLSLNPEPLPHLRALLWTRLHERLAAPITCLVVVLIALPFGVKSGRHAVLAGVASSLLICFTFVVLSRLGIALGSGGYVPPWLGAWLPNVVFGATGTWLTARVR